MYECKRHNRHVPNGADCPMCHDAGLKTETMRTPQQPDFQLRAQLLLSSIPVTINAKDWYVVRDVLALALSTIFVEGMQEARERIEAKC